tara:strand:+ start:358 stop:588 length:231 start_codon:yes stop_codon:yes gene_type:complete
MIHSDLLNSLTDNEKVMLLGCVIHATKREYNYEDLQFFRRNVLKQIIQDYYNIVNEKHKPAYKKMVDKLNKLFKSL